ncbi:hypothetical protein NAPIS_ORF00973 [Vairimorpha apis BRL 01]|uniref:Uncharacterized protein n=1 Tax=Vairimorpha apis BRL 01 TaxID=1037528 RepID=T0LAV8_9MICR|nr:hypothetical protein NAPIS_ORF00973 [Vairimorpha apis BRL 01]
MEKKTSSNMDKKIEEINISTTSISVSLTALLESVKFSEKEWPQQELLSVIIRLGRMPRGGWNKASDVFNAMFSTNVDTQEFKRRA